MTEDERPGIKETALSTEFLTIWEWTPTEVAQPFGPDDRDRVASFYEAVSQMRADCSAALRELPEFAPHSFRKTLVRWADQHYRTREAFKAFSQNIGHESVVTTVSAYDPVSQERQGELIRGLAGSRRHG